MIQISEVLQSIFLNRAKTIIAGISVLWGIMLLVLLSGTGKGLQDGIKKIFSDYTTKTIVVYGGEASISEVGISNGELVLFSKRDIDILSKKFSEIEHISPVIRVSIPEIQSELKSSRRFQIIGVNHNYFDINTLKLKKGRFFNSKDIDERYIIIGPGIAKNLFNTTECLGRIVFVKNTGFKVIGVISDKGFFNDSNLNLYISTEKAIDINSSLDFDEFIFSLNQDVLSQNFQKILNNYISKYRGFNPKDKTKIFYDNVENEIESFNTVFRAINLFLWFIGVSFLISGMLGIFNVMTVIVNERVGEFGIRKAFGAPPASIQKLVLLESLIITSISGIIGLIVGIILILLINTYLGSIGSYFNLTINLPIILLSLLLLVFTGCVAGILPARRAAKIRPIEALRELN